MRRNRRNRKLKIILTAIGISAAAIAITVFAVLRIDAHRKRSREAEEKQLSVMEEYENNVSGYIKETSYDGSEPVNKILFSIPFQKTDAYIPNRDLITDHRDEILLAENMAEAFLNDTFGSGYRKISENPQVFRENVESYFDADARITLDNGESVTPAALADGIASYYIANHVQTEMDFDTASCLVYRDGYTYVRGELSVTSFHIVQAEHCKYIPEEISLSDDGKYIVEVALKNAENKTGYVVTGYTVLLREN